MTTGAAPLIPIPPSNGDTAPTPGDIGFKPPVLGLGDCTNRTEKISLVLTVAKLASELRAMDAQSRPSLRRHDPLAALGGSVGPPILGVGSVFSGSLSQLLLPTVAAVVPTSEVFRVNIPDTPRLNKSIPPN